MKKIIGALLLAFSVIFFGCKSGHDHSSQGGKSQNDAAAPEMSKSDALFEEVMNYHDEAMPKMGKLKGYENLAQAKIDSLSSLKDAGSQKLRGELETLLASLKRAQKGMMDWMDEFNPEPEVAGEEEMIQYYEAEKVKAKAMRDDIFATLEKAQALLGN